MRLWAVGKVGGSMDCFRELSKSKDNNQGNGCGTGDLRPPNKPERPECERGISFRAWGWVNGQQCKEIRAQGKARP